MTMDQKEMCVYDMMQHMCVVCSLLRQHVVLRVPVIPPSGQEEEENKEELYNKCKE